MAQRHLEGVRVVELGTHVVVPKATRMMADWGAEVIKVEPPKGEAWRGMGLVYNLPVDEDFNLNMQNENANKKDIVIDLKTPEGQEVMHKLLATADVFISNTRPNPLKKLGMDYDTLKAKYPKLICAYFTGYGPNGPDKDRAGLDVAAFWCRGGVLGTWTYKGNPPSKPTGGLGDGTVASALLAGVLAALFRRERTGEGERIDISLLSAALWYNCLGVLYGQEQFGHKFPKDRYAVNSPQDPFYMTKDGDWLQVSIIDWPNHFPAALRALGLDELIGDERAATVAAARKNIAWLIKTFDEAFAKWHTKDIMARLQKEDLVHERVALPHDLPRDEQSWANGYLREVAFPNGEKVVYPNNPVHFASTGPNEFRLAPKLGADTVEILKSIGYDDKRIQELMAAKAVVQKS